MPINSRCLVTGANGFIGTHLCNKLESLNNTVIKLDRELSGVLDRSYLYHIFQNIDYVFHLAAISTVPACEQNPIWAHEINVTGTFNVLIISKECKVKRLVLASSSVVHDPKSVYAVTKVIDEIYCNMFNNKYQLPITMLRFYNVYGIGQPLGTAVIPSFIRKLKFEEPIVIEGNGLQTRDFIYVDDIVDTMIQSVDDNIDGAYDIGTGDSISINSLAYLIANIMGKKTPEIIHTTARCGDIEKSVAAKAIWFNPKYSLEEGLKRTIESWS